jgi:hypothetical protein
MIFIFLNSLFLSGTAIVIARPGRQSLPDDSHMTDENM